MGVAFTGQIIHTFLSMFTRFVVMQFNAFMSGVISVFECMYIYHNSRWTVVFVRQGTAGS